MRTGLSFAQNFLVVLVMASCCSVAAAEPTAGDNKLASQTVSPKSLVHGDRAPTSGAVATAPSFARLSSAVPAAASQYSAASNGATAAVDVGDSGAGSVAAANDLCAQQQAIAGFGNFPFDN